MSRGSTLRHAQTAGDLGFAVQFNAETPWHFAQLTCLQSHQTINIIGPTIYMQVKGTCPDLSKIIIKSMILF